MTVNYRGVKHKKVVVSSLLLLRLFHQTLPYLKSNIRELAADNTDKAAFEKVLYIQYVELEKVLT